MATITNVKRFNAKKIYDTTDPLYHAEGNAGVSLEFYAPYVIQISAVPATSVVQVQARLTEDAPWAPVAEFTDKADSQMVMFDKPANFVRVARTSGVDDITAYAQG